MRITNRMITNSYSRSINNLFADMNKLNNQVITGRKFSKSSEDTAAAVSAYQIRRNLSKAEDYKENTLHAKDFLSNSESVLDLVNESLQNAMDKIRMGLNATQSEEERGILAEEIKTVRDQILQTLNTNSTGIYMFGGSNTVEKPFGVALDPLNPLDTTEYLTYNGVLLKNLDPSVPADADIIKSLQDDGLTIDVGMGLTVNAGGDIDPSSIFTYSIPGIEVMTAGTTVVNGENIPNNLYDQLSAIVAELEKSDSSYDRDRLDALFGRLEESAGVVLHNITKIGAKSSYLNFMDERYDTQILNLQERQTHVEGADPALTIISFETQKVAYQAALQMGVNIIQPSIFNFMS
ncbi:MAG TPA: hypothetical protein VN381_00330 [Anaerovoracaceae bacterium]|nr:hypothetical protein [Anaerovoracaceae bacterium]